MQHHLVIIHPRYLNAMLAGRKTIECRLSSIRRPPFQAAASGDLLWFKLPSGPVRAFGRVAKCRFVQVSGQAGVDQLAALHRTQIDADPAFWRNVAWAQYASLVWVRNVVPIAPFDVQKTDRRAWVVLDGPPRPGERVHSATQRGLQLHI